MNVCTTSYFTHQPTRHLHLGLDTEKTHAEEQQKNIFFFLGGRSDLPDDRLDHPELKDCRNFKVFKKIK